jgi:hypothetical protein
MIRVLKIIAYLSCFFIIPLYSLADVMVGSPRVKTSKQRHFDINKDKMLDQIEREYLKTHLKYKWPLARTDSQKIFDVNGDRMLSPIEMRFYQECRRGIRNLYCKNGKSDLKTKPGTNKILFRAY